MSKRYDASLKAMLEASPGDWPRLVGLNPDAAEVVDAAVPTVTAPTDKVLRLRGPDAILHLEFQAGPDASLPRRAVSYNALLEDRHELPVKTVVVLLRREANLQSITGVYRKKFPGETKPYLTFRYGVVRVWELSPESLLSGGLGTLALAPISAVTETTVRKVIDRMKDWLDAPRYRKVAPEVWTAAEVLMGLRYEKAFIDRLLQGVRGMKESVTYQAILEEGVQKGVGIGREEGVGIGELKGVRRSLLRVGERQFGVPPSPRVKARLEAIDQLNLLERLLDGVPEAATWEELLATLPAPGRKQSSGKPKKRKK